MTIMRHPLLVASVFSLCVTAACSGGGGGGGGGTLPNPVGTASSSVTATATPRSPATATPSPASTSTSTSTAAPAPTPTPSFASEQATSADRFVDSMGINTHIDVAGESYAPADMPQVETLLQNLGVRHLRDGAYGNGSTGVCSDDAKIAALGIDFEFITQATMSQSDLQFWTSCTAGFLESLEAPNEYDIQHPMSDTDWPATIEAFQKTLWAFGQAQTPPITIVGPAFTTQQAYETVGNLAAYMNDGNMHEGFAGYNPGTAGYGSGGYGSIAYNVGLADTVAGTSHPVRSTEVPYATAGTINSVSWPIQAKYVPRLFGELYRAGLPRSFYFELLDEPGDVQQDGLVADNYAPKPAYAALKNLIALLGDPGPSFSPPALQYSLFGNTQNVHHLLLAKRDGSFYLLYWIEAESWNPNTLSVISVAPQAISLDFAHVPGSLTNYTYDATSNSALSSATIAPAQYVTVEATDDVSILHIVP